jgi:hypothetical protein
MSYQASEPNVKLTDGPWSWTSQMGEPVSCYRARVWDDEGKLLATLEPTSDPVEAGDTARFIAVAGTLASQLPEGCDPLGTIEALPKMANALAGVRHYLVKLEREGELGPQQRSLLADVDKALDATETPLTNRLSQQIQAD